MEFSFKSAIVKSGSKAVDESAPFINMLSTFNQFKLNKKAMQLIGVGKGDRVVMFDMGKQASGADDRFFVCKGFVVDGVEQGALLSSAGSFSYNVVYGAMLANDPEIISIGDTSLVEKGLLYPKDPDAKTAFISKKTAVGTLAPFGEEEVEVYDKVYRSVYAITGLTFSDHEKREKGDDVDEANKLLMSNIINS